MSAALHRLMYGLLFPAVLGTLFVLFVSDDLAEWRVGPRSLFTLVFISHWCFEFVLAGDKQHLTRYSPLEFAGDLFVIIAMYLAFDSLPPGGDDYQGVYFWVWMLPIVFLVTDLLRRLIEGQTLKRPIVRVDVVVFFVTGLFWLVGRLWRTFSRNDAVFCVFVAAVLLMSAWSFCARKDRLGVDG